jgi:protein-S-isoprenylcysteine O-methyltransferase Ste14
MRRAAASAGSAAFFLAAPGVVAGLVPWWITGWQGRTWLPLRTFGVVVVAAGLTLLVGCFARFVQARGTPAPIAPTDELVVTGAYRYVRNPMYVAVLSIVVGQVLIFGSLALLSYAVAAWAVMATFVRFYEEPTLARTYGGQFTRYRAAVPAWLPRPRPWQPPAR